MWLIGVEYVQRNVFATIIKEVEVTIFFFDLRFETSFSRTLIISDQTSKYQKKTSALCAVILPD